MSTNPDQQKALDEQQEFERLVNGFLSGFEHVFDNDWDFTKPIITDPWYIAEDGTFLNPKVEDEGNNWGNRGSLLASYRALVQFMKSKGTYQGLEDSYRELGAGEDQPKM